MVDFDLQEMARSIAEAEARQVDNLVAAAVLHYGVTDPAELVVCRQFPLPFNVPARIWVEPMTTKLRQDRVAALNEENRALRARIKELEKEADLISAAYMERADWDGQ